MARLRRLTLPIAVVALLLAGCGGSEPAAGGSRSDSSTTPRPAAPSGADAYQYLNEYVAHGLSRSGYHRTGTAGGQRVSEWVAAQFRDMGLRTQVEPFQFNRFTPRRAQLHFVADAGAAADVNVFPLYYSGTTGADGITAELVDVGSGSPVDFAGKNLRGKIVLAKVALVERALTPSLDGVLQSAAAAGAAAVVVAIQGPQNLIVASNVDSSAGLCGLPVLYIGKQDGRTLAARSGETVRFVLDAAYGRGTSYNVVARIPGISDQVLMIGTPINGWFATAAERGGGVGVLLTLARALAAEYRNSPPAQTLMFVATGGHELGYLGLGRYAEAHPNLVRRIYTYVHLGAAVGGRLYEENPVTGAVLALPAADPARTLYVSENPMLLALGNLDAVDHSMLPFQELPPTLVDPGEQAQMYDRGVPIVSISGTTLYFHTVEDLPDTTSAALLDPVVQSYAAIVHQLLRMNPALVRGANVLASQPQPAAASCAVPPK